MTRLTFAILAGLAAVLGMVIALCVVSGSLTPLIGTPLLAVAAFIALVGPRAFGPGHERQSSHSNGR